MSPIINSRVVPSKFREEADLAYSWARSAGAPKDLEFVGIGMFGVVFCDEDNVAWKVFYGQPPLTGRDAKFLLSALTDEYEWLRDASGTDIAGNVAEVYDAFPNELVLKRECIRGRPGAWADGRDLSELHNKIDREMQEIGWSAPEYKESSYIYRDGKPVLVDASMPHRIGERLADYIEEILDGDRTTYYRWHDLAFFLVREKPYGTIEEDRIRHLLERLVELDPSITESFVI